MLRAGQASEPHRRSTLACAGRPEGTSSKRLQPRGEGSNVGGHNSAEATQ